MNNLKPYAFALAGASVADYALSGGNFQVANIAQLAGPLGAVVGLVAGRAVANYLLPHTPTPPDPPSTTADVAALAIAGAVPWYFGAPPMTAAAMVIAGGAAAMYL